MPERLLRFREYADESAPGVLVMNAEHSAVQAHAHEFVELVYVKSGFCLHEVDKQTSLMIEGDFFMMPPFLSHRYLGTHSVELYNCLFEPSAVSGFENDLRSMAGLEGAFYKGNQRTPPKLHLDIAEQKRVSRLFTNMITEQNSRETGWRALIRCELTSLLINFARAYEKRVINAGRSDVYPNYVVRALEIIDEAYQNAGLSVVGIAKDSGVSPDYLSRQFKMLTGVGVQEYIRRYRFAKATQLLTEGEPVGEVSAKVGFSSISHFSREFKKEMGETPSEYAKQNT